MNTHSENTAPTSFVPRLVALLLPLLLGNTCAVNADTGALKLAFNDKWPPYSYKDSGGEMRGILVDIARDVLGSQLNIQLDIEGYPWKRVQANIQSGVNDAFITAATPQRLEYSIASEEIVYTMEERAFINVKSKHYKALKSITLDNVQRLNEFRVCDMIGNGWAQNFYGAHNIKVHYLKDINLCFRSIAANRYDVAIHIGAAGQVIINGEKLGNTLEMQPAMFDSVPFPLLVSKRSSFTWIIPLFDKAMAEYKAQGAVEEVVRSYTQ